MSVLLGLCTWSRLAQFAYPFSKASVDVAHVQCIRLIIMII